MCLRRPVCLRSAGALALNATKRHVVRHVMCAVKSWRFYVLAPRLHPFPECGTLASFDQFTLVCLVELGGLRINATFSEMRLSFLYLHVSPSNDVLQMRCTRRYLRFFLISQATFSTV